MNKFEIVTGYEGRVNLPKRATGCAAGYDFEVAETTIVPSYLKLIKKAKDAQNDAAAKGKTAKYSSDTFSLEEAAAAYKLCGAKPTLVPTGIKCRLYPDEYLELSVRSSLPLKHWLILANGTGIIDADYYNNEQTEGHVYFQLINLGPFDIELRPGDRIGQGIFKQYDLLVGDYPGQGAKRVGGFGSTSENK